MRRLYLYIIYATLLLGILPGLTSCRQKELVFPEAGMHVLDVSFEWPDTLDRRPQGMTLWFFSLGDDRRVWRFDIAGADGGPVELPDGDYDMLACSNDVAGIRISGASDAGSLTASLTSTDSIAQSITPLYRARVETVSFTPASLKWTEEGVEYEHKGNVPTLVCHPAQASTSYDVELRDIRGLERIRAAALRFHGVCRDLLLYDARSEGEVLDLAAAFGEPDAGGVLRASFGSFGPLPDVDDAVVEVTVTLDTRRTYRKTFLVGDQIANRRDRLRVKILIEGLSIPDDGEPPDNGVGMEVGVDGWTEIHIDYTTGP